MPDHYEGKTKDPDFEKTTIHIRVETKMKAEQRISEPPFRGKLDLSDLMEAALAHYLEHWRG